MVGNLVGGLAQGFAQGYDLGNKMYENSQQRKLRKGLGEIYDPAETEMDRNLANRPNVKGDVGEQDQMMNRTRQERQLYAQYGTPQQLSNFNRQALNQQTQGLRLQQLQGEMDRQAETDNYIEENAELFQTDPLAATLELTRISGDADALATLGAERADMVASNAAYEYVNANDTGLAASYENIRDNQGVTINRRDDGVNQFVVHAEGDPSNVVETIEYRNADELRSQLTPRLAEASPVIGNKVYALQSELAKQRREAMGDVEPLSASDARVLDEWTNAYTRNVLMERGIDSVDAADADSLARARAEGQARALERWQNLQRGTNGMSARTTGGIGGGGGVSIFDPSVTDYVRRAIQQTGGTGGEQTNPEPDQPIPENLPPRMQRGLE